MSQVDISQWNVYPEDLEINISAVWMTARGLYPMSRVDVSLRNADPEDLGLNMSVGWTTVRSLFSYESSGHLFEKC